MMAADGAPDASAEGRAALARLRRIGGERLVRDMATLHLATAADRLDAARRAVHAGDVEALARAAHALRSSCGQFGAAAAVRICAELERAAEHEPGGARRDHAALEAAVDRLGQACDAHRAWLERELTRGPGAAGAP